MSEPKLFEPDTWAVVDILGHQTFAGKISEHVIGGTAFIRVDVPELPEIKMETYRGENVAPKIPAYSKLIGAGSIYAITPCSEEVARKVAAQKRTAPVNIVEFETRYVRTQEEAHPALAAVEIDDECPF